MNREVNSEDKRRPKRASPVQARSEKYVVLLSMLLNRFGAMRQLMPKNMRLSMGMLFARMHMPNG